MGGAREGDSVLQQKYDAASETPQIIEHKIVTSKLGQTTNVLRLANSRQEFSQLVSTMILASVDFAGMALALALAILIRVHLLPSVISVFPPNVPSALFNQLWWVLAIGLLCMFYEGLYTMRLSFWRETRRLVRAATLAFLLTLAIVSLGKMSGEVSRTVLMLGYMVSVILLPMGRLAVKTLFARVGLGIQPVLILGAGKTGKIVANALLREKYLGYSVAGFLDDDSVKRVRGAQVKTMLFPVLGGFSDSEKVMEKTGIRHLIIAAPGMPGHELAALVNRLQQRAASVTVIPDLFGVPVMGVEADYSFDDQMLSFRIKNNLASRWNMLAKRTFDLIAGILILVAALPIMAIIAAAIKLDSAGPVFFSHRRIGRGGKEFECHKFRTMRPNNEEVLSTYLSSNPKARQEWDTFAKLRSRDPRATRVGQFLRRFSLDELPQIFNVLKGEMSLVGPRPYLQREFVKLESHAASILLSRPGITGLWQVSGRNEINFKGRLDLESWYVRNWSLWLDITLLVRTVGVVLARRGAY